MKIVDITPKEFASYLEHPKQRNTEFRAARATHLKNLDEQHELVAAIKYGDKIYKADGHTRSWLWENKHVKSPKKLKCIMFDTNSLERLYKIYEFFDNTNAVETPMDKQYGTFRSFDFYPQSNLVKRGGLSTAVRVMTHNMKRVDIEECVSKHLNELKIIDKKNYAKTGWVSALYSALIATVRKDGEFAFGFWDEFVQKNRTVVEVSVLLEHIAVKRAAKVLSSHYEQQKLAKYAINLYNKFSHGKGFNIQSFDIITYMEETK